LSRKATRPSIHLASFAAHARRGASNEDGALKFHYDQKLQPFTRSFLNRLTTAVGYLPAGRADSSSLSLLFARIRASGARSSPALTCLPLTFLALRGQLALLLLHL